MGLLARLNAWWRSRRPKALDEWFFVTFDDTAVTMKVFPPGKKPWAESFPWESVVRVCFKDEGMMASDGLYVFTSIRPESFVIPTEASGGSEFFDELGRRGLFPGEIMMKAICSTDGGVYCWPPAEKE